MRGWVEPPRRETRTFLQVGWEATLLGVGTFSAGTVEDDGSTLVPELPLVDPAYDRRRWEVSSMRIDRIGAPWTSGWVTITFPVRE
ncbi:hypothetical protein CEE69_22945 [Rhodopirellula bahusiensis]|uniref:Uncharacterized protein n=1 Tax=Rhodopirellula bahusiensis TaxID=2014065 RepID=A0A2G1W1F8_9BACT|nr:hypothetical protein CEE69_22945 [Rhodopirellula bahusiensis]